MSTQPTPNPTPTPEMIAELLAKIAKLETEKLELETKPSAPAMDIRVSE